MKPSGIGGQAVIEGVMMKNQDRYAVAVRKPDHEIEVLVQEYKGIAGKSAQKIPIARGILNFVDSLVLGIKTLMYSSTFFEEEETVEKDPEKKKKEDKLMMGGTLTLAVVLAVAIFMVLPYFLSLFFQTFITSAGILALLEGILRLVIFILYIAAISVMKDIQRVYMYHGAEHKCINCIEHGLELNVENVKLSSKQHKRCGTSFLLIVMIVSIFFGALIFAFVKVDSHVIKLLLRLLLIPIVAGVH